MEDDLNFLKMDDTSIFSKMKDINTLKDNLNLSFYMEDDLIFYKSKTTKLFDQLEDDLNILVNGR
jgi:hypothetical protein